MFSIFKGWDGSWYMVPYSPYGGLAGYLLLAVAILIMGWLIIISASLMYLPALSILAGIVLMLYMSQNASSDAINITTYFFCVPFFAYGWTGLNWAMFVAASQQNAEAGIFAVIGWLISAVIGLMVFMLPATEICDSNAGGLIIIPMMFLWFSAILAFPDKNGPSKYLGAASTIVKYCFRVLGIMMAICLVIYLVITIRDLVKSEIARKDLTSGAAMFVLGLIPIVVAWILGSFTDPVILTVIILLVYAAIAFIAYDKKRKQSYPNAKFVVLPILIAWFANSVSSVPENNLLVPLEGAKVVVGFFRSGPLQMLAQNVGEPTLAGLEKIFGTVINLIVKLVLMIFDARIPEFGIPYMIVMILGFFAILLVYWLGSAIRNKTAKG